MRRKFKLKSLEKAKEECKVRKKLKKAAIKRTERKTPYPLGFEYKKW